MATSRLPSRAARSPELFALGGSAALFADPAWAREMGDAPALAGRTGGR